MKRRQKANYRPEIVNLNIEDTSELLTRSAGGSRTRRLVLTGIAVILIAAIATAGILLIGEKRYNDRVELAEKAFAEGDYQTAETEYLAAIQINKRKVKAREGLAYTYAVEGKTEEAVKIYDELYKDTKDEKYKRGGEDVSSGGLPSDPDLIPAKGYWRSMPVSDTPYLDRVNDYLFFLYIDNSYCYWDGGYFDFDCTDDNTANVLTLPMTGYGSYGVAIEDLFDEYWDDEDRPWAENIEGLDPRKWSQDELWYDLYGGYERYEEDEYEQLMKDIFNISDKAIANMLAQAEAEKQVYKQDGYYYCVYGWPTGVYEGYAIEINDVMTDGQKFCVCYDAGESLLYNEYWENDYYDYDDYDYEEETKYVDRSSDYVTMYAVIEFKVIDGKHYISLYYNGTEMPAEVSEGLTRTYGDGQDALFSELNGVEFGLGSGVGGWGTTLEVSSDGSFTGYYHDNDMGVTDPDYPYGVCYYSTFFGKFANARKISNYEYRVELAELKTEDEVGTEYIDDGVLYVAEEAYGVQNAKEFAVYLPGMKYEDLPSGYVEWLEMRAIPEDEYIPELTFYGLYNIQEQQGFTGYRD
ncbi:MAG: tetratricopeptide repeat protein [Mogibacterium sp.]|nr:tetratricopeptide repeat protein [Mogibacterium sp.]